MRVSIIVGTRPQIIKSQPLVFALKKRNCKLQIIHTGQHYDYQMSKAFFDELKINDPDINLGIRSNSQVQQLAQIISKLEKPLISFNPNFVIVPGDTRSALAAAICGWNSGFKVVHVEAGARSMDLHLEEEINRRIIDSCSTLLFAPTKNCLKNLQHESMLGASYFTGDTMYDVFLEFAKKMKLTNRKKGNFVLVTIHRKNNIENVAQLTRIINFLSKIESLGYKILFPMHPHTQKMFNNANLSTKTLTVIKPVKYSEMLNLLSKANLLITDSGGLQKEAYWLSVPTITLRSSTEWIETIRNKNNVLIKQIDDSAIKIAKYMLTRKNKKKNITNEFGNGKAAQKMTSILFDNLQV
jgi:UDP-N-acetylglucosamine 2-epimerase